MYAIPVIEYYVSVWATYTNQAINQSNSIQRRSAQIMSDYHRTSIVPTVLSLLQWCGIEPQHKEACFTELFTSLSALNSQN